MRLPIAERSVSSKGQLAEEGRGDRSSAEGAVRLIPRQRTFSVVRSVRVPEKLRGTTHRLETPLGTMFVNITGG